MLYLFKELSNSKELSFVFDDYETLYTEKEILNSKGEIMH